MIMLGHIDNESHVIERVPRRQTEHQRQGHLILQSLYHLNHLVVTVASAHPLVSLAVTVERDVQVPGMMETDGFDHTIGCETIGKQRVVRVMFVKPCHDFQCLRMENELTTFQAYGRVSCHTSAMHHSLDVIKRQVFYGFLPDIAMLAARLAGSCGVNHQL